MIKRLLFFCLTLLFFISATSNVSADNKIIRKKTVRNATITAGNRLTVFAKGKTLNTKIMDGGIEDVFAGAVSQNAQVFNGGRLWLAGGKSYGAVVHNGGLMEVREHDNKSSYSTDTKLLSGGRMNVFNHSLAEKITVGSNGFLRVYFPGAVISDVTILSGGLVHVWKHGTAQNVYVAPGGVLELREESPVLKGTIRVAGQLKASFDHDPDVSQAKIILDLTQRNVADDFCVKNFAYLGKADICINVAEKQNMGLYKLATGAVSGIKDWKIKIGNHFLRPSVQQSVLYADKYYTLSQQKDSSITLTISQRALSESELSAMYEKMTKGGIGQFALNMGSTKAAYYFAEHNIMQGDPELQYAVIYIHGANGGERDAAGRMRNELKRYKSKEKVYCIAPSFFTEGTCPANKQKSTLIWDGGWRGGSSAVNGNHVSNFDVIDKFYRILSNRKLYPKMKRITLAGFSAGGQCVNRYVAVGKMPVSPTIETVFVVGNPSVYLYIDKLRFQNGKFRKVKSKANYNSWFLGLDNRYPYCKKTQKMQILKNLYSRSTLYFCGTTDTGKAMLDVNEEAMLQGRNRYERFLIYQKHVARYPDWKQKTRFFSVPDIAHSSTVFYKNNIIQKWVFGEELPGGDK